MPRKSLSEVVSKHPFPDYAKWWNMGDEFMRMMAEAISAEWVALPDRGQDLGPVQVFVQLYVDVVYRRTAGQDLVVEFIDAEWQKPLKSGEFDALSYGFYRSAFDLIAASVPETEVAASRRNFTRRVGARFFDMLQQHLSLELPPILATSTQFKQLDQGIQQVGKFLKAQGYLRDKFAFSFDVSLTYRGDTIQQTASDFLNKLLDDQPAYAIYEMGYPAILPSAVYLYQSYGEAQHHSSRTIEELFSRVGCEARETPDFNPTDFPSDRVVELWEIRQKALDN